MNPQRFAESNIVMRKPANWSSEQCCDIHAFVGADEAKQPLTITAWRPTPEDLVKLNLGEPLYLVIYGGGMPPVALVTENPWRQSDPEKE